MKPRRRNRATGVRVTQLKKERFLQAYTKLGNISAAANYAKIERKTHYNWLDSDEAYRDR